MIYTAKNRHILTSPAKNEGHAFATYRADKKLHGPEIFEEIAIGQSIGAWDERFADLETLQTKVAKLISFTEDDTHLRATIAFPLRLWHGRLSWLLTLIFGKMSFYRGVTLEGLNFNDECFEHGMISGPKLGISDLRRRCGGPERQPLLMGILKPNVAMSAESIADLYSEVAEAGVHLVKDDEIRHDENFDETLRRIEKVSRRKSRTNLKTLYVAHAPLDNAAFANLTDWCRKLESAGADAILVNVWTAGLQLLQTLRQATALPLVAHPALAGAFGQGLETDAICPSVALGSLLRAAGADLSLFPSPYGKIGLPKKTAVKIAATCSAPWPSGVLPTVPVPSAGIKPEHVGPAMEDFGHDFILNAGTAIFASGRTVAESVKDFLNRLEVSNDAR